MEQTNSNNYLTILLQDIENSKNYLAGYNNLLTQLKASYFIFEEDMDWKKLAQKMSPKEKQDISTVSAYFKTYAIRSYINFKSISQAFPKTYKEKIELIETNYNLIKSSPLPAYDVCEAFVQNLNDIFVEQIKDEELLNYNNKMVDFSNMRTAPTM